MNTLEIVNKRKVNFNKIKHNFRISKSISEYMLQNNIISEEQDEKIRKYYADKRNISLADTMHYELKCFEFGFIDEKTLISIITNYRNKPVMLRSDVNKLNIIFDTLDEEYSKKNFIFEFENKSNDNHIKSFICSFKVQEKTLLAIQSKIENFRIYYTLPCYLDDICELPLP